MKSQLKNQRGSVLLETAVSLAFIVLCVTSALTLSYFAFARIWIERTAYELILCLASQGEKERCERISHQQTSSALPIGRIGKIKTLPMRKSISAEIPFLLGQREIFRIRDKRRIPLRSGKKP